MSLIHFIKSPFPDNHDGFDYTPKSFTDVQREQLAEIEQKEASNRSNKLLSMIASIFK